jgi:hypothetical protein
VTLRLTSGNGGQIWQGELHPGQRGQYDFEPGRHLDLQEGEFVTLDIVGNPCLVRGRVLLEPWEEVPFELFTEEAARWAWRSRLARGLSDWRHGHTTLSGWPDFIPS